MEKLSFAGVAGFGGREEALRGVARPDVGGVGFSVEKAEVVELYLAFCDLFGMLSVDQSRPARSSIAALGHASDQP